MIASDTVAQEAANYLSEHDPVLAKVIAVTKLCTIRPHQNYYAELVDSIVSQQLSVKASASILRRFNALFGGETVPEPAAILTKDTDTLRSAGLSRAKALYVSDLARHVVDGRLTFDDLDQLSNEEVITKLTAVKGIGEWTAHMFLMFAMGRTDVLPHGDLGIKNGIRALYGFEHQPAPADIVALAERNHWHPYESIACWYVWQSLDNEPAL